MVDFDKQNDDNVLTQTQLYINDKYTLHTHTPITIYRTVEFYYNSVCDLNYFNKFKRKILFFCQIFNGHQKCTYNLIVSL